METNLILLSDSYKVTHWKQYEDGTDHVFSFFESRGGAFPAVTFFGLQYFIKRYLTGAVVTAEDIDEAEELLQGHFGANHFNRAGWEYILKQHGGRLPVEIRAIPEGTEVPVSNALMTVVNTDHRAPWITNYIEGLLSQVWYPCTVATRSREMKRVIKQMLERTGDPEAVGFKLHDFGFRGCTSVEAAGLGGAAHLVNFVGTDTLPALQVARRYYGADVAGYSVPAAEHSTVTSWGKSREADAYRHMLERFPTGIISVVSDSYDIYSACRDLWGGALREQIINREGVLVIRPDSGDPVTVVNEVLNILGERFGFETNAKGYKVLHPNVRVIQGDGIDYVTLTNILRRMQENGWSGDNIVFGSGGGLLQKMDRDTQKFAFKCSAASVNGIWKDVMKDPVTDQGKRSKAGRLALININGKYVTVPATEAGDENLLKPVFRNGELLVDQTFDEIRERAAI